MPKLKAPKPKTVIAYASSVRNPLVIVASAAKLGKHSPAAFYSLLATGGLVAIIPWYNASGQLAEGMAPKKSGLQVLKNLHEWGHAPTWPGLLSLLRNILWVAPGAVGAGLAMGEMGKDSITDLAALFNAPKELATGLGYAVLITTAPAQALLYLGKIYDFNLDFVKRAYTKSKKLMFPLALFAVGGGVGVITNFKYMQSCLTHSLKFPSTLPENDDAQNWLRQIAFYLCCLYGVGGPWVLAVKATFEWLFLSDTEAPPASFCLKTAAFLVALYACLSNTLFNLKQNLPDMDAAAGLIAWQLIVVVVSMFFNIGPKANTERRKVNEPGSIPAKLARCCTKTRSPSSSSDDPLGVPLLEDDVLKPDDEDTDTDRKTTPEHVGVAVPVDTDVSSVLSAGGISLPQCGYPAAPPRRIDTDNSLTSESISPRKEQPGEVTEIDDASPQTPWYSKFCCRRKKGALAVTPPPVEV